MWKSEILIYDKVDEVIEKLFESLLKRHPIDLEKLTKGSEFIFNFFHLFYNKGHKIKFLSWCITDRFYWLDKKT